MAGVALRNIYWALAWDPPDFLVPRQRSNFVPAINFANKYSELVKAPGTGLGSEVLSGLMRLLQLASGTPSGRELRLWGWRRQAGEALEWPEHLVVQVEKGCSAQASGWRLESLSAPHPPHTPERRPALFESEVLTFDMEVESMLRAEVSGVVKMCWAGECEDWALQGLSPRNWVLSAIGCCVHAKVHTSAHQGTRVHPPTHTHTHLVAAWYTLTKCGRAGLFGRKRKKMSCWTPG